MRSTTHATATAIALLAVIGATATATATSAATRRDSATESTRNTAQWCAAVIRINTKYGAMKHKRYIRQDQVPMRSRIAIFEAALREQAKLLAITPPTIKKAMRDELAFFAHLKANHYADTTPLTPLTIAEVNQLSAFQRTKCGITGL
jgi:hypothetical protein